MGDFEYQVTAVAFGLGLQRGSTRTVRLNEHIREVASDGWQFVAVDHSAFEIPLAWRFFWDAPRGRVAAGDSRCRSLSGFRHQATLGSPVAPAGLPPLL